MKGEVAPTSKGDVLMKRETALGPLADLHHYAMKLCFGWN